MLSARAYSFRQTSRLAISLSWIGGYTNVVVLISCGFMVSHVSGTATHLAHELGDGQLSLVVYFAYLLATFFAGAVISALLTESAKRRGNPSKYVLPVALEALLLALLALGTYHHRHVEPTEWGWRYWLTGLASMAMGLQNATITRISGSVVRTTHVTGVVTDLGLEGVQFLLWWLDSVRGRWATRAGRLARVTTRHPTFLRLLLLASIFGSFLFGASLGTLAAVHLPNLAMVPPVLFLCFIIFIDHRRPIADVRELDLLSDPDFKAGDVVKSMLPKELGIYRFSFHRAGDSHRAPDFQVWAEHIPSHCKVVILAVSPVTRFDTNAVMDLEAALRKLNVDGRELILCGLTPAQIRSLDAQGISRMMDTSNLCPDLEFAIARGMAILQSASMRRRNGVATG